jgi:hypothetical protein
MERTVERELIPMAKALNLGVLAWSPLARGVLTGKYHGEGAKGVVDCGTPHSNTAWSQLIKTAQLLHRIDTSAEAGLITRGGIYVQRALLDCLVECGHRLAVGLFGGLFVALFNGLSQAAQCGAQAGGIYAIGGRALRGLTCALKGRKMICHV